MASFRKRGSSWEYRIKYNDPVTNKKKEKTKGGFRTKKEAQIEAAEIEKKFYFNQHQIIQSEGLLVKDWLDQWIDVYGKQCEKTTLITRKRYINKQIIPSLGNYKLSQLSKMEYEKFINKLSDAGYARRTVQTIHSIFCTAINKAVDLELISHNKFTGIKVKQNEQIEDEKVNFYSKDEVDIFINSAKTSKFHHYLIAVLLLRTGMRKGEMLALTWDDINFEEKTISITKTRSDLGVKKPKTPSSKRIIGIDNTLIEDLKKNRLWQKKNKIKYGQRYGNSSYLILKPDGTEMGEYGVNKVIDAIIAKTNLHHLTPHGLRHTHAIMLLESGANIKFVSTRLGHATINMTANVYIHITKKYETENVMKLEAYLNN